MPGGDGRRRFEAFISYAHADEAWAAWVQRSLERFRVPKRLRQELDNPVRRLYPVFRDRTELASSTSLSDAIVEGLRRSKTLIVIGSPAAAASRWVNEEIHRFREIGPDRKILCLLVDGSPDPDAPDCGFPPALLADREGRTLPEPLAADPRPSADGKRGARYKLAAGLLGVDVDQLRQRDLQRRYRLMAAFGATGIGLAVVMALLAWTSLLARQEAELRRAQAEDLIEFMLVDLRGQLEAIGRLDLLDSVGQEAMNYFQTLGTVGTPEDRLARAMALRQIGEVRASQGRLALAQASFEQSLQWISALVKDYPDNPQYLFELGQSEYWVGFVHWERGELDLAMASMARYRDATVQLNERWPNNADHRQELTYTSQNLGAISLQLGDRAAAIEHIRDAVDNQRELVARYPGQDVYVQELANALSWLGSTLEASGDLERSSRVFAEAVERMWPLHEAGKHVLDTEVTADLILMQASGQVLAGEFNDALAGYETAGALYDGLLETDATNALWQEGRGRAEGGTGTALMALGRASEASAWFRRAVATFRALSDADTTNTVMRSRLANATARLAHALAEDGELVTAVQLAERAEREVGSLAATSTALSSRVTSLADSLDAIGAVYTADGDETRARAAWERGLALMETWSGDGLRGEVTRVRILHRLGRGEEAAERVARLSKAGVARRHLEPGPVE